MLLFLSTLLFLDFSGGEFLLIAVVFLMFFGSKSIPGMARALGKAVRDFKEAANSVQREIHESATVEEVTEVKKNIPPSPTIPQQTTPAMPVQPEANSTASEETKSGENAPL